ncbi:Tfp pilus assembly protein FimT/FimU [Rhodococcus sp. NPDC127528]|uniref:pilus assembly FimT family protein n=1 Tax=unclassified Rhodococcus (in: high G+C Gram-positive bacteria) TaxID=192944 RepID=UPI0036302662
MTVDTEPENARGRTIMYVVVAVTFGLLLVLALIAFSSARSTAQAEQKANQLIAALEQAGAHAPSEEQLVRVLGDDGGAICADPNSALTRATLLSQMANGAGGPGTRPVIVDDRVVKGELLVLGIYCPDQLADFQQFAGNLHTSDVASY